MTVTVSLINYKHIFGSPQRHLHPPIAFIAQSFYRLLQFLKRTRRKL